MQTDYGTARAAHGLEVKFMPFDGQAQAAESGVVQGYASLFGEADQGGDVVAPGAFRASLARLAAAGRKVKFLWQHDPARPIGVWQEVREDARGLNVSGEILADVVQGAEALTLMRAGAVDGLSIGYRTVKAEANRATGGRRLLEIDLWEVSLVTFPMLPTARAMLATPDAAEIMELALAEALAEGAGHPR
ncbi:MAG: HK97 family phage prohead protease [Alphaproteobacteria bacterium]